MMRILRHQTSVKAGGWLAECLMDSACTEEELERERDGERELKIKLPAKWRHRDCHVTIQLRQRLSHKFHSELKQKNGDAQAASGYLASFVFLESLSACLLSKLTFSARLFVCSSVQYLARLYEQTPSVSRQPPFCLCVSLRSLYRPRHCDRCRRHAARKIFYYYCDDC